MFECQTHLFLHSNKQGHIYYKNRVFEKYPAFMLFYSLQQMEKSMKKRGQRVKLKSGSLVVVVKVVIADSIQGYLAENEAGDWKWYLFPEWEEIR